jgi:hypothetical protein
MHRFAISTSPHTMPASQVREPALTLSNCSTHCAQIQSSICSTDRWCMPLPVALSPSSISISRLGCSGDQFWAAWSKHWTTYARTSRPCDSVQGYLGFLRSRTGECVRVRQRNFAHFLGRPKTFASKAILARAVLHELAVPSPNGRSCSDAPHPKALHPSGGIPARHKPIHDQYR